MRTKLTIATAAAAALLAGAAFAQPASPPNAGVSPAPDGATTGPSTPAPPGDQRAPTYVADRPAADASAPPAAGAPADPTVGPAARAPAERAPTASVGGVDVVTNGPVPDTPENRAKYGKPDSHGGRASKPDGN